MQDSNNQTTSNDQMAGTGRNKAAAPPPPPPDVAADPFDINRELSYAPRPEPGRPSNIVDFYNNRSVLITGASGFIGKVLIEKLLRTCPGIRRIFVLIRPKWNKLPEDRLRELLEAPLFNGVRHGNNNNNSNGSSSSSDDISSYLSERVQLVEGDVTQVNLGLSKRDLLRIMNEVSVIFHSAATVKFDEPLKQSIAINIAGTKNMLDVCRRIPQLAALVHVSTAYANCDLEQIDEHIYPVDNMEDPERLIKMADWLDQDTLQELKKRLLAARPNTYTYTKALAEWLLVKCARDLPVVVCRPSIVVASWREPFSGWIDNVNGPTGIILGAGKGLIRSMYAEPDCVADLVPVDTVINLVVTLGWFAHIYKSHQLRERQMKLNEAAQGLSESLLLATSSSSSSSSSTPSSSSSPSSGPSSIAPSSEVDGDENEHEHEADDDMDSFYIGTHHHHHHHHHHHDGEMSPPVSMGSVDMDRQLSEQEEDLDDEDDGLGSSGAQSDENDTNNNNSGSNEVTVGSGGGGGGLNSFHHPNHDLYSAAAVAAAAAAAAAVNTSSNINGHDNNYNNNNKGLLDDGYGSSLSPEYAPSIASSASSGSLRPLRKGNNNNHSQNIRKAKSGGKTILINGNNININNNNNNSSTTRLVVNTNTTTTATGNGAAANNAKRVLVGAYNQQQFHIEQQRLNDEKQADFDYKLKQFRHHTRAKLLAKNLPEHLADIPVFHCTSGGQNPMTWGRLQVLVMTICAIFPSIITYRWPSGGFTNNHYLDKFYAITLHYLPAYLMDFITRLIGGKPILVKIFKKFDQAANVLKAFTSREWKFDYDNRMTLINELMTQEDRRLFNCDIRSLNWDDYMMDYIIGVRKFMLKEPMSNLDEARKRLNIVYYRNLSLQILMTSLVLYYLTPSFITTTISSLANSAFASFSSALAV